MDAAWWLTQLSALLIVAMGVAVLFVKPRTRSGNALAGLLASYGAAILAVNLVEEIHVGNLRAYFAFGEFANVASAVAARAAAASAALPLVSFPRPLRPALAIDPVQALEWRDEVERENVDVPEVA